jgi:hypothetical protein
VRIVVDPCFGQLYHVLFRILPSVEIIQRTVYRVRLPVSVTFPMDVGDGKPKISDFIEPSQDNDEPVLVVQRRQA